MPNPNPNKKRPLPNQEPSRNVVARGGEPAPLPYIYQAVVENEIPFVPDDPLEAETEDEEDVHQYDSHVWSFNAVADRDMRLMDRRLHGLFDYHDAHVESALEARRASRRQWILDHIDDEDDDNALEEERQYNVIAEFYQRHRDRMSNHLQRIWQHDLYTRVTPFERGMFGDNLLRRLPRDFIRTELAPYAVGRSGANIDPHDVPQMYMPQYAADWDPRHSSMNYSGVFDRWGQLNP